nr:hypothetical protein 3 [Mute swan feces associated tombus-like virus 2]
MEGSSKQRGRAAAKPRQRKRGKSVERTTRPVPKPAPGGRAPRYNPGPAALSVPGVETLFTVQAKTDAAIVSSIPIVSGLNFPHNATISPAYVGKAEWLDAQAKLWTSVVFNNVSVRFVSSAADTVSGSLTVAFVSDYLLQDPDLVATLSQCEPHLTSAVRRSTRWMKVDAGRGRTYRTVSAEQFELLTPEDKGNYSPGRVVVGVPAAIASGAVGSIEISYNVTFRGKAVLYRVVTSAPVAKVAATE